MALVLAVAGGLRLIHILSLRGTPFFNELQLDARAYDEWAQRIADGRWIGGAPFFVDPLYAYVLGVLYRFFDRSLFFVRLIQAGLDIGTCVLTARIGRRTLGSNALGNLAALLVAIYIPLIHSEAVIEKTTLSIFLATLALDQWLNPTPRAALGAGIALGLGILARGNMLIFVPIGALGLLFDRANASRRSRAGLFVAGASAIVVLATVHNIAAGEFALTTTNAGQNFYIGQHRGNEDGTYSPPPFVRPDPRFEEDDFRAEAERAVGHTLSARDVSSYWRARGFDEIRAAPGAAVARTVRKLRLFWDNWETPDNENIELVATFSPVLRLPVVRMWVLLPLALLGATVARRRPGMRAMMGAVAVYTISVVAFFVVSRFRLPIVPVLAIFAAAAISALVDVASTRVWRPVAPGVVLAIATALVLAFRPDWLEAHRRSGLAIAYHNLGTQLVAGADTSGAIDAYERAIAIDERSVVGSLRALGDLYFNRGDYAKAEVPMRRVVELKPQSRMGYQALVRLYQAMLRDSRTMSDPRLPALLVDAERGAGQQPTASPTVISADTARANELSRLAHDLAKEGRWPDAIAALEEAVQIGPYDEGVRYQLGQLMDAHASGGDVIRYWSTMAAKDPKPQTSYFFWAVGLEKDGDLEGAVGKLRMALETDPAHEMSENRWGLILEKQEHLEDALAHFRTATEIFPEFREAHDNAARVLELLGRHAEAQSHRDLARSSNPSTPRRYVYWARWLMKKGRTSAAGDELKRALAENPNNEEARNLLATLKSSPEQTGPATSVSGLAGGTLSPEVRARLVTGLRQVVPGASVWFALDQRNPDSWSLTNALRDAFVEAGWVERPRQFVSFRLKPGISLFAAEERPPAYVDIARESLERAGIALAFHTGYRAFFEERRRTQPDYVGVSLASDQSFVIVVGPPARSP